MGPKGRKTSAWVREGHPWRCGCPHQVHFLRREAVGVVHEIAQLAFELQHLGGEGAGVLGAQGGEAGGGEGLLFAAQLLHLGHQGVAVEVDEGGELLAGLFQGVFDAEPVQHRALRLLLAGGDVDEAAHGGLGGFINGIVGKPKADHGSTPITTNGTAGTPRPLRMTL